MFYSCNIIILSFASFLLCCAPSRARLNFVLFLLAYTCSLLLSRLSSPTFECLSVRSLQLDVPHSSEELSVM
jgi:hypothetical protein